MIRSIATDLRYGWRRLLRSPGFLIATVVTLALGVGLNTAIFALIHQVLLEPLPYRNAAQLVAVTSTRDGEERSMAWFDFLDWQRANRSFSDLAAYWRRNMVLTVDGDAEQVRGLAVTSNLFGTLGVAPEIGRGFAPDADRAGARSEVVLTHELWQRRYGADPNILERSVRLDGQPYRVIGVMPPGFRFPDGVFLGASDFYLPAGPSTTDESWQERDDHPGIYAIGRMRRGVTIDQARRDLSSIAESLGRSYPESNGHTGVLLRPALEEVVGDFPSTLEILFFGVGAVLLIAIANVSGLAAARVLGRGHEIAVRSALGARRGRIVRLLLSESVIVGALSFMAAWAVAWAAIHSSASLLEGLPRLEQISLDPVVMLFALCLALVSSMLAGLIPCWRLAGRSGEGALGSRGGEGRPDGPLRAGLLVLQVALALVLLSSSVLLARTLFELRRDRGGIRPEGVLTFKIDLPETRFDDDAIRRFHTRLLEQLRTMPGVRSAGMISPLPFSGAGRQAGIRRTDRPDVEPFSSDVAVVTPGYFESIGVELLEGRLFRESDQPSGPAVAVADERFASRFWPGKSAIGRHVEGWGFDEITIIGVVRHVKNYGVRAESRPELYFVDAQRPFSTLFGVVRTGGDPDRIAPAVRRVIATLDPEVPVSAVRPMTSIVAHTRSTAQLAARIGIALSALATVLAALGLYSLLTHELLRRRRELGIRMALGADPLAILALVSRQSARLALTGAVVGLIASWWVSRFLEGLLYRVEPWNVPIVTSALGTLVAVMIAASLIPMIRAVRSDPSTILRES